MKKTIFILLVFSVTLNIHLQAQTDYDFKKFEKYIRQNKTEKVLKLIKKGKNINSKNELGMTPLLSSLSQNKPNMAEIFIDAGADINTSDIYKRGSLQYAIRYCKSTEITYKLVEKGANINHLNKAKETPFHYAVISKCPEIPFYLIEKGADYKSFTSDGKNAIHFTALSGCDSLFDFLVQQGIDYNIADNDGNTPLLNAIKNNHRSVADKLLALGVGVMIENTTHHTPIFYAIENSDTLIFDKLIERNAKNDVAVKGVPPIYLAASKENLYFIEALLRNGAENPMKCDIHDICYQTAFIYSVSASIADESEKLRLYNNSMNIFNLAKEKYKDELNKIRAKNAAKVAGDGCLMFLSVLAGSYYVGGSIDYQSERISYLKNRIKKCDTNINEIQNIISTK